MTEIVRENRIVTSASPDQSAISGGAIFAGGVAAAALTLVLLAFGSGMGFSSVSPWAGSGVSSETFKIATGVYLIVVAMLASTIGGYIAGRLRTRWTGVHSEEVLFRDTAHGFLAWALATVLGAAALGAATTYLVGGVGTSVVQSESGGAATTQSTQSPTDYYVDELLRPASPAPAAIPVQADVRVAAGQEIKTILMHALGNGADLSAADRSYLGQVVSARTGLAPADADQRVAAVMAQAKTTIDRARKTAAELSMWLAASMLVGAFSASLAAIEGGQLRDGRWKGILGGKNYSREQTT